MLSFASSFSERDKKIVILSVSGKKRKEVTERE